MSSRNLMKTCRRIDPELSGRRDLVRFLQKHACNLNDKQAERLSHYISRQPAIAYIYDFKEELMAVLISLSKRGSLRVAR